MSLLRLWAGLLVSTLGCSGAALAQALPGPARAVIQKVHAASARQDFAALEALMGREFVWSFGGDAEIAQALAEWKRSPAQLRQLHRVTGLPCAWQAETDVIECPRKAGTGFRAGFKQLEEGWRMVYFVAGD